MSEIPASSLPEILTADQVAEMLQVSRRTFDRMVAAGEFPRPMRRNRKWIRWTQADLEAYFQKLRTNR
jgi:excisionase family DNA binding protein